MLLRHSLLEEDFSPLEKGNYMSLWSYFYFLLWSEFYASGKCQLGRPGKWRVIPSNKNDQREERTLASRVILSSLVWGEWEGSENSSTRIRFSYPGYNLIWKLGLSNFSFSFHWVQCSLWVSEYENKEPFTLEEHMRLPGLKCDDHSVNWQPNPFPEIRTGWNHRAGPHCAFWIVPTKEYLETKMCHVALRQTMPVKFLDSFRNGNTKLPQKNKAKWMHSWPETNENNAGYIVISFFWRSWDWQGNEWK